MCETVAASTIMKLIGHSMPGGETGRRKGLKIPRARGAPLWLDITFFPHENDPLIK